MGSLSISTHRGCVHFKGLLLIASLFNFWSQLTTAQLTVESTNALEGMDVTLYIRHRLPNAGKFLWYRGGNTDLNNRLAYLSVRPRSLVREPACGPVRVEDDGSLLLKNVTMEDSGTYTILVQLHGCQKLVACGRLTVYPHVSAPTLRASRTRVTGKKDAVIMICCTDHDHIEWFFKGRSLTLSDRMTLSLDSRNLTIYPVLRRDAGDYQCEASNPRSSRKSAPLRLVVKSV